MSKSKGPSVIVSAGGTKVTSNGDMWLWDMVRGKKTGETRFVVYNATKKEYSIHKIIPIGTFENDVEIMPDVNAPFLPPEWPTFSLRNPENPHDLMDVSFDKVFVAVKSYIKNHLDLPDNMWYDILTLGIMATYILDLIPLNNTTSPYFLFLAPRESGKTRALEVSRDISYKAYNTSAISAAALRRDLNDYQVTACLDEGETLLEREGMLNLLLANRKNEVFRFCTGDNKEAQTFRVFGIKFLSSRNPPTDTLLSRAFIIPLKKSQRKLCPILKCKSFFINFGQKTDKNDSLETSGTASGTLSIPTLLLLYRYYYSSIVSSSAPSVSSDSYVVHMDRYSNRFGDISYPLKAAQVAQVAQTESRTIFDLNSYLDKLKLDADAIEETEEEGIFLDAIKEIIRYSIVDDKIELKKNFIPTKSVCDMINAGRENWPDRISEDQTGRMLRRLGFRKMRTNRDKGIEFNFSLFKSLCVRYHVDMEDTHGQQILAAAQKGTLMETERKKTLDEIRRSDFLIPEEEKLVDDCEIEGKPKSSLPPEVLAKYTKYQKALQEAMAEKEDEK